jgi:hypothetical protein
VVVGREKNYRDRIRGRGASERIRDKGGINEKARERRNGERIRAKGHWKGERQRDKG